MSNGSIQIYNGGQLIGDDGRLVITGANGACCCGSECCYSGCVIVPCGSENQTGSIECPGCDLDFCGVCDANLLTDYIFEFDNLSLGDNSLFENGYCAFSLPDTFTTNIAGFAPRPLSATQLFFHRHFPTFSGVGYGININFSAFAIGGFVARSAFSTPVLCETQIFASGANGQVPDEYSWRAELVQTMLPSIVVTPALSNQCNISVTYNLTGFIELNAILNGVVVQTETCTLDENVEYNYNVQTSQCGLSAIGIGSRASGVNNATATITQNQTTIERSSEYIQLGPYCLSLVPPSSNLGLGLNG